MRGLYYVLYMILSPVLVGSLLASFGFYITDIRTLGIILLSVLISSGIGRILMVVDK